jgi:hypothetical protein
MATEKWIASVAYTDAIATANLSAIASGNAVGNTGIVVANATNLDMFGIVSVNLASLACVAPNYLGVYLYPLNKDGTTYGDGRFNAGSAAGPPPANYQVGTIGLVAATQAQEGSSGIIVLPPTNFIWVLYNQAGIAFATGSVNTFQYKTFNRSVA